ncbi:helix-turn-helix domain-containing protein [Paucibacter sp. R3-3]|uniref:Helix-turn-helix domain-containing protein n=1 Tax=Roseateles agri TaxID=3098619 RepID=A0ABU5DRT3_9BURK|nr:helix-turn-helix domain-containing protein [Paucibacter sp. R3-3]MDY0749023.1 helix-turn-helix domain-containing protein [Paucibacter sp. R3-3]
MASVGTELIQRWSTEDVAPSRRLDYFAAAVSEAVTPLTIDSVDAETFHGKVSFAQLGAIGVSQSVGAPHRSSRGKKELARNSVHVFNLMTTLKAPWNAEHRGSLRMMPRDVLILDSSFPLKAEVRQDFSLVNLVVTEAWLRRWVPDPSLLVARRIPGNSMWGLALSSYLGEMSPELAAAPPLPLSVMADQVGSLLALTVSAMQSATPTVSPGTKTLHARIRECIAERCTEPELTASDVATSLGVSVRTMHRTLAAVSETFGRLLIDARSRTAVRMLTSPLFKRVTTGEIGRRAGFVSGSHFVRVIRLQHGMTPRQLRARGEGGSVDGEPY